MQDLQQASARASCRVERAARRPRGSVRRRAAARRCPAGAARRSSFDGVTFGYERRRRRCCDDVSFRLAPGRGARAARPHRQRQDDAHPPAVPALRPDGGRDPPGRRRPARRRGSTTCARRVGMVTQDVQLFHATRARQPDLLRPARRRRADPGACSTSSGWRLAARAAATGSTPSSAPGGGGLSAGEAQLLAFARVFLHDPGLVILDEASSRLDPATERLLERAVDAAAAPGAPAIIIAHRLATVERADEILILEDGRVVEHGAARRAGRRPRARASPRCCAPGLAGGAGMSALRAASCRLVALQPWLLRRCDRLVCATLLLPACRSCSAWRSRALLRHAGSGRRRPGWTSGRCVALLVARRSCVAGRRPCSASALVEHAAARRSARCCAATCFAAHAARPGARAACRPRPARRSAASATTSTRSAELRSTLRST